MLLANASHELRTPLTRIRLGLELAGGSPERRAELEKDIAELDQLVDEILLLSRLDAAEQSDVRENVDLTALAAEESRATTIAPWNRAGDRHGDPALLRRMIRNLVDNASFTAGLDRSHRQPQNDQAILRVTDHGPVIDEVRETGCSRCSIAFLADPARGAAGSAWRWGTDRPTAWRGCRL